MEMKTEGEQNKMCIKPFNLPLDGVNSFYVCAFKEKE